MALTQPDFQPANPALVLSIPVPYPQLGDTQEALVAKLLHLQAGGRGIIVKAANIPPGSNPPPYDTLNDTERCIGFVVMSSKATLVDIVGDDASGFTVDNLNGQELVSGLYIARLKSCVVADGTVGFYLA